MRVQIVEGRGKPGDPYALLGPSSEKANAVLIYPDRADGGEQDHIEIMAQPEGLSIRCVVGQLIVIPHQSNVVFVRRVRGLPERDGKPIG